MWVILAKFPLLSKIQTLTNCWSDKYLITTIVISMQGLSSDFQQFFLVKNNFVYFLTYVHNNADDADATDDKDDANDYNMVTGIALLKAFSCAKKGGVIHMK